MKKLLSLFLVLLWLPLALAAQTNTRANNGTFTGNVSVAGTLGVTSLNGIVYVATPCTDVTIQAALTAVSTPGAIIQLPKGTCLIANPVVVGGAVAQNSVTIRGHGTSAQAFGVGSTGTGTILKWTGAANGTVFQVKSVSNSTFEDFTVDCNTTGGIGLDFTAVNAVQPSVDDHFNRIGVSNCLGTPGQGIHVGSSTNQEAANSYFSHIRATNNNDNWFQEGTQTVDIYVDDFQTSTCVNNGINLRAGSLSLNHYAGGGGTCTTQIRLSNSFSWANFHDIEIETSNTSPFLAETSNPVGTQRTLTISDSTFLWLGIAGGKLIDIQQGLTLNLRGVKFTNPANTAVGISLQPAAGLVYLSESGSVFPTSPAVTRSYLQGSPGVIGVSSGTQGDTALPFEVYTLSTGNPMVIHPNAQGVPLIAVKNTAGHGAQIGSTGGSGEYLTLNLDGGATQWQFNASKGDAYITETTCEGGSAGLDLFCADASTHRLSGNNNNGGKSPFSQFTDNLGVFASGGTITPALVNTSINCSSSGGTCTAAPSGAVSIAAASTTVTVNTTAVTANSDITVTRNDALGTRLSVTCNTATAAGDIKVSAISAGTSFTIAVQNAPVTNPLCLTFSIRN